jgi:DnaK suppressor protein
MTDSQRLQLKSALEAKRQELLRGIQAHSGELSIHDGEHDPIDQVQGMNRRDEAAAILFRLSRTLSQVDQGLRAISEGCYGFCAECEEPIGPKRLNTIAWASYCLHCQEALERREAMRGAGRRALFSDDREAA